MDSFPGGIPMVSNGGGGGTLTPAGLVSIGSDPIIAAMMKNYAYARNVESCPNCHNPSTIGQHFFGIGSLTYPRGNNPKSYNGQYNYSYVPTNLSEFPAIGHDRRYDNLEITGALGLFTDPRAIGADWTFVKEELTISFLSHNPKTKFQSGILGIGLGLASLPKTLLLLGNPHGYGQIRMWYDISNYGVNNTPTIHEH